MHQWNPNGPVGVLAVQGDFEAHVKAVRQLSKACLEIRRTREMKGICALIMPGGESSTMLKFLIEEGLDRAILNFAKEGGPILATCAGVVLLAKGVLNPKQSSLGLLDIDVVRNGYGRQVFSTIQELKACKPLEALEAVFIRAPRIVRAGPGVKVLARRDSDPVLISQGKILGAVFHPELSQVNRIHPWFIQEFIEDSKWCESNGSL